MNQTLKKASSKRIINGSESKKSLPGKLISEAIKQIPVFKANDKVAKVVHLKQVPSNSTLEKAKAPAAEYMASKEAHTINDIKNSTKFTFEVPIKKPKHTRNGR